MTKADLLGYLNQQENRAYQAMTNRLKFLRGQLEKISQSVMFRQPERLYDGYLQKLDRLTNQLQTRMKRTLQPAETGRSPTTATITRCASRS